MPLKSLLEIGKREGASIDERIIFESTESAGISAFITTHTATPLDIQIPNSLIIKPENAFSALDIDPNTETDFDSVSVFKFYIACLKIAVISNAKFQAYIDLLPTTGEIHSPLSMSSESLYVFENTDLKSSIIEKKLELLKTEYLKVCFKNTSVTFENYLWAHLIITSRAFPYRIVNPNAKLYDVMLLPIIDLLNHKPHAKVEWSSNSNGDFKLSELEIPESNASRIEIFNNYGPKGNAELLMGYGFVIEDNEFDTLQLSLTLHDELKKNLTSDWNVKLPTLHDFTHNVCDDNTETTTIESDQMIFMLNVFHPIPDSLLQLFCYISKNEGDKGMTLKNVMNGLNKLKQSLEVKYANKLDKMPAFDESVISKRDYDNAKVFRKGQLDIYNLAKNEIKSKEKTFLKEYRKNFITIKDIYKKDTDFQDFIDMCSWEKPVAELSKLDMELIFRLWMMKNVNEKGNEHIDVDWFVELFDAKNDVNIEEDEFMVDLYNQLIPSLREAVPELTQGDHWNLKDWLVIDALIVENSYEKGKTQEPLLIKPVDLY